MLICLAIAAGRARGELSGEDERRLVHALIQGWPLEEACRFGNAAGAAAAMTPGTDLAPAAEIHRLYAGSA